MSMIRLYKAAVNFITREMSLLGDADILPTQEAQLTHFCDSMQSFPRDVEDAGAMYTILDTDSPSHAFTPTQRTRMAHAISIHMRGVAAASVASTDTKNQSHLHQYNYWSNQMWEDAWNMDYSKDQVFSTTIDWYLAIGLRFASDDTVKQSLAMIMAGREQKNTPQQNYDDLHEFKRKLRIKRELYKGDPTFKEFPASPCEFTSLYSDKITYDPVDTRVEVKILQEMTHKDVMPSRSNNKRMNGGPSQTAASSTHRAASPSRESDGVLVSRSAPQRSPTTSHLLQSMARQASDNREFQERMCDYMMNGGRLPDARYEPRSSDIPSLNILDRPPPRNRPAQSFALKDRDPPPQPHPAAETQSSALQDRATPPTTPGKPPDNLQTMIDELQAARLHKKTNAKPRKTDGTPAVTKTKTAKKNYDVDSDAGIDSDSEKQEKSATVNAGDEEGDDEKKDTDDDDIDGVKDTVDTTDDDEEDESEEEESEDDAPPRKKNKRKRQLARQRTGGIKRKKARTRRMTSKRQRGPKRNGVRQRQRVRRCRPPNQMGNAWISSWSRKRKLPR